MNRHLVVGVLGFSFLTCVAFSAERSDPVDEAFAKADLDTVTRGAELAKKTLPLLEKLEAVNAKAKDPKKPVGEQLTQEQRDEFSLLNSQIRYLNAAHVFGERHRNDMQLLQGLYRASKLMEQAAVEFAGNGGAKDMDTYILQKAKEAGLTKEVALLVTLRSLDERLDGEKK